MPPKAKAASKSSTASYTSMTTRSEPTNSHSVDSDNESLIEPAQEQGSSLLNERNYSQIANSILTGDGRQQSGTASSDEVQITHNDGPSYGTTNAKLDNAEIGISRQKSTDSEWSSEANNELAKFGKIDPTMFITKLEDAESFHSFEYTMSEYINNVLGVDEDI